MSGGRLSGTLLVLVLACLLGLTSPQTTSAVFTDAASVRSGTFTPLALQAPTTVACTGTTTLNRYVTWTAPAGQPAGSYRVVFTRVGATEGQSVVVTDTRWRPASSVFEDVTYEVRVQSMIGEWLSPQSTTVGRIRLVTFLGIPGWSCPA